MLTVKPGALPAPDKKRRRRKPPLLRNPDRMRLLLSPHFLRTQSAAADDIVKSVFGDNAQTLDIILLLTGLALIPTLIICLTGFTRIVIVLGFVKNAIGMQNARDAGHHRLALIVNFFVMTRLSRRLGNRLCPLYAWGK
jgi:flagellar biosynthesis protein FliP